MLRNWLKNLSPWQKLLFVVVPFVILTVAISLALFPEWGTTTRTFVVLIFAAIIGVLAFLDTVVGSLGLFAEPSEAPQVHIDNVTVVTPAPEPPSLDEGLQNYLRWVETRYGRLDLRGVEERAKQVHKLTLEDVYVSLRAVLDVAERDYDDPSQIAA